MLGDLHRASTKHALCVLAKKNGGVSCLQGQQDPVLSEPRALPLASLKPTSLWVLSGLFSSLSSLLCSVCLLA